MAAYAALVSLMHIIEQIQNHPRPPFYLDNKHAECLIQKVTFLQKFLEDYSHIRDEQVDRLESRIAEAAYAAEDVIETHVVDQILAQSAQHGRRICSVDFYKDLQKVIQNMDFIKNEVMDIEDKMGLVNYFQQHRRSLILAADSSRSPSTGQHAMVGCDDVLKQIMDKLTQQQYSNLQVIPIVGMGGIGKTTLAKNVYEDPFIVQHFYIRAWATISQKSSTQKILLELLLCLENQDGRECFGGKSEMDLSGKSEMELRDTLYKSLYTGRYLIILDDLWSMEAWNKIKSLFPNDNNGSRVIITTRLSRVASNLTGRDERLQMNVLNDDMSWNLFCKIVFGANGCCPLQLEKIGRKIAKSCKGLPLAIVVIGGLLAKSEKTLEYWEYIVENLTSLEEKEHCLNVLYTSYNHLPIYLKPCFLYTVILQEDATSSARTLIQYWIAEGFLKSSSGKSLEEVGAEYLKDLIDRNLILAEKRNRKGEVRSCKIHDLLRDLSLRESQKNKFFLVTRQHSLNNSSQDINTQRRVAILNSTLEEKNQCDFPQIGNALRSASLARTLLCESLEVLPSSKFRLLRALMVGESSLGDEYFLSNYMFQLVNLRFFAIPSLLKSGLPSSIYLFWNLQTFCIDEGETNLFEIWRMPLLRWVRINRLHITNPGQDDLVLGNLHFLCNVADFRCSEKVVERIPNIKELGISYDKRFIGSRYCLNNLARLYKLERLCIEFLGEMPSRSELLQNVTFPDSLKELILDGCRLCWEDISTKIGSLPHLQVLKLIDESFIGPKWETIEGQFSHLKILKIKRCSDLECWNTDSDHFPCLERLVLAGLGELKEIPLAIGDIPTLRLIKLINCSYPAVLSAKKIAVEQEELENPDLHVFVQSWKYHEEMKTLAGPNFEVVR